MQVTPTEISASAQVTRTAGTMRHALDAMAGDSNQPLCVAVAAGIMPAWASGSGRGPREQQNNSNDTSSETHEALSAAGPNKRMKLTKRGILVGRCLRWALLH